jgi:hypothetical protein
MKKPLTTGKKFSEIKLKAKNKYLPPQPLKALHMKL